MNQIVKQYHQSSGNINNITSEFVDAIKKWVQLDDLIKDNNDKNKLYRKKKNELAKSIKVYMEKNQMQNHDINITGGGKVRYRKSTRMVPLNKDYIRNRLLTYYNGNQEKADKLTAFICDDRERVESSTLTRTRPRK